MTDKQPAYRSKIKKADPESQGIVMLRVWRLGINYDGKGLDAKRYRTQFSKSTLLEALAPVNITAHGSLVSGPSGWCKTTDTPARFISMLNGAELDTIMVRENIPKFRILIEKGNKATPYKIVSVDEFEQFMTEEYHTKPLRNRVVAQHAYLKAGDIQPETFNKIQQGLTAATAGQVPTTNVVQLTREDDLKALPAG